MKNLSLPQRIGAALLLSLLAVAFLQPYFYPIDTSFQDLGNILASGSEDNWFGTDHLGRDMFALRCVYPSAYHSLALHAPY